MITFIPYPLEVIIETDKEGWLLYVQSGEQWNNDIWTVVHKGGGIVRHYQTKDVLVVANATFGIEKTPPKTGP